MSKFNLGLLYDKIFRKTIFLRPLKDGSFEAIDITGCKDEYITDSTGGTLIDPSCVSRVRGLKRVDYIAMKFYGAPILTNLFNGNKITVRPPKLTVKGTEVTIKPPNLKVNLPEGSVSNPPITHVIEPQEVTCPHCNQVHTIQGNTLEIQVPDTNISIPEFELPVPEIKYKIADSEHEVPDVDVTIPSDNRMTEKTFGDTLNYAEIAGRMQSEGKADADKKQNYILLACIAAVLMGILIYWKMNGGGV